jgi:hypothetical protein
VSESLSTVASEAEISVASQEFSGAPTPTKAELLPQLHDNTTTPPKYNPQAAEFQPQSHNSTATSPEYNPYGQAVGSSLSRQTAQHHNTISSARLLIIFNLDYLHHNTITSSKPWQPPSHPTAVPRLNQTQRTCHCTPTRTCPPSSPR